MWRDGQAVSKFYCNVASYIIDAFYKGSAVYLCTHQEIKPIGAILGPSFPAATQPCCR